MNETSRAREQLAKARAYLNEHPHLDGPSLAAGFIRDLPELEQAELTMLAWLCYKGDYGCNRNDAAGLFDLFEQWLDENEANDERS